MLFIKVPDLNDSFSSLSIDGREYWLRFTYNETHDYWSFGIYRADKTPIVTMTKIVPNFPLLHFYNDEDLPDGVFGCITNLTAVGRNAFNEGLAEFCYIPNTELEG